MSRAPALLVVISTALSFFFTVQVGALTLASGLALLALMAHLQRASRRPWRSQRGDILTLSVLALTCALLALLLP